VAAAPVTPASVGGGGATAGAGAAGAGGPVLRQCWPWQLPAGGFPEGDEGRLAAGQPLQRPSRVARCVAAAAFPLFPTHQHMWATIALQELE
jgi:hypothetical protein